MEKFDQDPCFKNIQSIDPKVGGVLINVKKEHVKAILDNPHQARTKLDLAINQEILI
jgi:hypothetical protein